MTLKMQNLVGNRVHVSGADINGVEGSTVLDSTQWEDVKAQSAYKAATDAFDQAVADFYAPVTAAQEELAELQNRKVELDPIAYVVLTEGEESYVGTEPVIVSLNHDSQVLRLLEDGNTNRLVWVGDSLEILAAGNGNAGSPATPVAPVVSDDDSAALTESASV